MEMKMIRMDEIIPNPLQPREAFDREKLKELADTVSEIGVLQPIVVRPKGNRFEIIAGERRWKASQIAGKTEIPAIVKDVPDEEVMIQSLIENVHRMDLKPIEQAKAILEVFKAQENFLLERKILSKGIVDERLPQKVAKIRMKIEGKEGKYYKDSTRFSIDEKTRREQYLGYVTYPFETWSNKELKHKGWFYTLQAGYISYGTVNTDGKTKKATKVLEILFFPLTKALKIWFESNQHNLKERVVSTDSLYHTHNRLVNRNQIRKYAGTHTYIN